MKVFGFSLIRNGLKYDYCFQESFTSLSHICEKVVIAAGDSEDDTHKALEKIEKLEIVPTQWDMSLREGGIILSQQTQIALEYLRNWARVNLSAQEFQESWAIYLQGDEVFHENDYQLIHEDLKKALDSGHDAMSFCYLHFWQSHDQIAINKKWYPHEIRAIKLDSHIESWGDAQGFRKWTKTFFSQAKVYHYGHVRSDEEYKIKKRDMLKLYHQENRMAKYRRREKRYDSITECLQYTGPHPVIMKERIKRIEADSFFVKTDLKIDEIHFVGDPAIYSSELMKKVQVRKIYWYQSLKDVDLKDLKHTICLERTSFIASLFNFFRLGQFVPQKMRSKLSKQWSNDFYFIILLSQFGIKVD